MSTAVVWRKSSYSGSDADSCVEITVRLMPFSFGIPRPWTALSSPYPPEPGKLHRLRHHRRLRPELRRAGVELLL